MISIKTKIYPIVKPSNTKWKYLLKEDKKIEEIEVNFQLPISIPRLITCIISSEDRLKDLCQLFSLNYLPYSSPTLYMIDDIENVLYPIFGWIIDNIDNLDEKKYKPTDFYLGLNNFYKKYRFYLENNSTNNKVIRHEATMKYFFKEMDNDISPTSFLTLHQYIPEVINIYSKNILPL